MSCSTSHAGLAARAFVCVHASRAGGTDARISRRVPARRSARFEIRATDAAASPPPTRGRVSARWIIDTRYGHKAAAISLLGEWIHTVGAEAGLDAARVSVFTGQLGCPESRLEMHCEQFDSLAELDAFFAALPVAKHRAWGETFAEHVVDGSPTWHVLRTVPVTPPSRSTAGSPAERPEAEPETRTTLAFADDAADVAAAVAAAASLDVAADGFGSTDGSGVAAAVGDAGVSSPPPPRVKPRAPKRLTKEQADAPVFAADAFGDAAEGLVFPPSGGDEEGARGEDLSEYEPGSKVVMDWKGEPMVIRPGDKLPNVQ